MNVLPDSTGRELLLDSYIKLNYANASGNTFNVDDIVTGVSSGVVATVGKAVSTDINTGYIIVKLNKASADADLSFTNAENLQVGGSTIAQASGVGTDVYVQPNTIVSQDNPTRGLKIDSKGAALVRFLEGQAQLDAFGTLETSQKTTLASYSHIYDELVSAYTDSISGSAAITYESNSSGILFTNSGVDGDLSQRTTDMYHPYSPGKSQTAYMTIACGDMGKTNLIRRWGYYDDNDGFFFEQSGSNINIVLRSSTSGQVVETAFSQSAWNVDKLDGSKTSDNISLQQLDTSKNNIYWFDFQWLGAGSVRAGVDIGGSRITAHTIDNANSVVRSYIEKPNLPLRFEQINSGTVGSTSEMRYFCGSVLAGGSLELRETVSFASAEPNEASPGDDHHRIIFPTDPARHCLTVRPKVLFKNKTNRSIGIPTVLTAHVQSGSSIELYCYRNTTLTGSTDFISLGDDSPLEYNAVAEIDPDNIGDPVAHWTLQGGEGMVNNIDLVNTFGLHKENIVLGALTDQNKKSYSFLAHNFSTHYITVPFSGSFFSGSNEIIRSSGDFTTDGFQNGMGIYVSGTDNNKGYYILDTVSALTMSLRTVDTLVTEGPIDNITISGGEVSLVHFGLNVKEVI